MDSVAHDVYGLDFRTGCNVAKEPGMRVHIGKSSPAPVYEIVAVVGDSAWIKPVSNGTEGIARLENLRAAGN